MYKAIESGTRFSSLEQSILKDWQSSKTFEASLSLHDREHIFYDGPPFPTGAPHHGTVFVSILKDSIARFFTMYGYSVPRVWGWDCHGLPIENLVEKKLNIQNKAAIESEVGVETFNAECRAFVMECGDSWRTYIDKIGRWVDYDNPYRTLDTSYMESVLWVFAESYKKDLIYKDYRVSPYCYRCETSLSISDTRESDSTRPRQDPEVVVRFAADEKINGLPTYYLAWTTTPWTLISNLALAVGEEFDYIAFEHEGNAYVIAEALLGNFKKVFGEEPQILSKLKGSDLVGKTYSPIFPYFESLKSQDHFRILASDHVTIDDGVGIVHMAPAFGEDDYWVCKRNGLGVQNPVDASGCFKKEISEWQGRNVLEANKDIIRHLKDSGHLLQHKTITHNYPHCWRCREPLIYRAMDAWYYAVEKIKDRLIANNKDINWVPDNVKEGRFGKWLAGARDWNISRSRYWGTPIPVWECSDCDHRQVLGSLAEIKDASGQELSDLHKDHLDRVEFDCTKCSGKMKRVTEVLDCWFESGSMPYGQCHYPFENKEWFESHFPADFIVEYPGQIRGWFYYLHVISTALFDRPAFKNCVVHGTLLAEDGSKISKSKKNYTDPMELVDKFGADALRIYLMSSPAAAMLDLRFNDKGIEDQVRNVLLPIQNAFGFFVTYANIDGFKGNPDHMPSPAHQLDRWILSALHRTESEVREAFCSYQLNHTLNPVLQFIEELTNWYIRRSRGRFWAAGMEQDKREAYETLYYVLTNLMRLLAPSAPFISDYIYRELTGRQSVHLDAWPEIPSDFRDDALVSEISTARKITSLGLAVRQKTKIKVRQPLSLAKIALPVGSDVSALDAQLPAIKEELNVQSIEFIDNAESLATIRAVPNAKRLGPRFGREMQLIIKAAREGKIRQEGEKVLVLGEDKTWELESEDIMIGYEGRDGLDVMSSDGILVSLVTNLTPELKEEGLVNDINRSIQDMRKQAGYEISDYISLDIEGDLSDKWKAHLAEQTLGKLSSITAADADIEKTLSFDKREFQVRLRR